MPLKPSAIAEQAGQPAVYGPEYEMIDEQLRASSEEVCQRGAPLVRLESILLADPDPRQFLPPPRQLVAAPCEFLFRLEQLEPRCQPLLTRYHFRFFHIFLLISAISAVKASRNYCFESFASSNNRVFTSARTRRGSSVPEL